jgi:N-methylhydantoinase B
VMARKVGKAKAAIKIDPIRYEMFVHRLMNVAEEGRIALQKVCASPIVVQGGECMSSFYEADGTTILSASGHLRFSAGCEDAVRKVIEYSSDNPGIFDGDQFFMNDPYIASTHVYDEMVVKPVFAKGKLIAWTASMTHTADTGGLLRGGATEIFHEGVRSFGIKLMERGRIRADVFRDLTQQCRDPGYVGLDLKSRIASNNVCARGFLQLVEKYGFEFVRAACRKLNQDSERMARARLASLPDGTWRAKLYATSANTQKSEPKLIRIVCAMTKQGDRISFDFAGTSPQNEDATNSTYVGSWGQLFVALTSQLFWNIPWNGGMTRPVTLEIPEGTVLNCRYPAACGGAPGIGAFMTSAASACIAKMLFAAGLPEDVNASWYGGGSGSGGFNTGGPGFMYGGTNQHGLPVGQGIYDMHASGFGAAPMRDGVASGGHMNNPTVGISDVENIEMQYPLLYLSRNHMTDSGGFGKFRGGLGLQRIILARGSQNLTTNYSPYHGIPAGWGLFGGYPAGIGGDKVRLDPPDLAAKFSASRYPVELVSATGWGKLEAPDLPPLKRMAVPEGSLLVDPVTVGSGYGDPLDRDPGRVLQDVLTHAVSRKFAAKIYGVVLARDSVDEKATAARRQEMRKQRLAAAEPVSPAAERRAKAHGRAVLRIHESLDIVSARGTLRVACRCCDQDLGPADRNYKLSCIHAAIDKDALTELPPPGGRRSMARYVEYYCPGCATLLDVETHCPSIEGERIEPVWDIAPAASALKKALAGSKEKKAA